MTTIESETRNGKKRLQTFLGPKRAILKKSIQVANKEIAEEQHGVSDVPLFSRATEIFSVIRASESFLQRRAKTNSDNKEAIDLHAFISSKKFVILGEGDLSQDKVEENDTGSNLLDIKVGKSLLSIAYANSGHANICVSGHLNGSNIVVESLDSADKFGDEGFFIPKEELALFVDLDEFASVAGKHSKKEDGDIERFENVPLDCVIYRME